MEFCYNQPFLPQIASPYTYYLSYLPSFPVQNYTHSTFTLLPLQSPSLISNQPLNFIHPDCQSSALQKKESGIIESCNKQKLYKSKSSVIQILQKKKREEQVSKIAQKESRNVLSNLLRILFKNILEVRMYDQLITKVIASNHFNTTLEDFYLWLQTYSINYKNYIRFSSVKRIMTSKRRKDHLLIFRVILQHYVKTTAVTHCLTSKRIDKDSVRMHLIGLRQLKKDLLFA